MNKNELLIDEEQAEIVRRIFDMSISGMGTQKIANILTNEKIPIPSVQKNLNRGNRTCLYGIWHSKTVRDILKNEDYIGNLTQCREEKVNCKNRKTVPKDRWIVAKGACPAIVDEDKFDFVDNDINGILLYLKDVYKTCSSAQMTYEEIGTDTKRYNEETLIPAYQIIRDIIERNKDIFMEIS